MKHRKSLDGTEGRRRAPSETPLQIGLTVASGTESQPKSNKDGLKVTSGKDPFQEQNNGDANFDTAEEEEKEDVRADWDAAEVRGSAPSTGTSSQTSGDISEEESDSSDEEGPGRNTVGDVPLAWYKDEDHIGYTLEGQRIARTKRKDKLDALLAKTDPKGALRTIYDEYNDEEITLSKDELNMLIRIRKGQMPNVEVNPYEPYIDWFTRDTEIHPLSSAPEPKSRFIPSKWEEKKIVKLVRAMRKGWLLPRGQKQRPRPRQAYLLWADDNQASSDKTGVGLAYIPAAKPQLPGHAESYNPPKEYVPTQEEQEAMARAAEEDPEEGAKFIPQSFDCLRHVPAYAKFLEERFERCLDLYLCPRVRRKRLFIDPETLVPELPKPKDLQPFPTQQCLEYVGHTAQVRCVDPHASGQFLLSGCDAGCVRLWEVPTARCLHTWRLAAPVACVTWCRSINNSYTFAAAAGNSIVLLYAGVGGRQASEAAHVAFKGPEEEAPASNLASWKERPDGGLEIVHKFAVKDVAWHWRGDYFATVCPTGESKSVLVHQLSKRVTQNPFKKNKGRVSKVAFHPSKPFLFVATQRNVRIYNVSAQSLAKKLLGGSGNISCMAIHPSGDHVLVGSEDKRLAWYDLDLSAKPYKVLRYHQQAIRAVSVHPRYPLFASAGDDAAAHVFHGMVFSDLMSNPLIVPLKVLRSHDGITSCAFHPTQPWLFTAGADTRIRLFCNP